jgi:MYXO-CTERM domain-containing protein
MFTATSASPAIYQVVPLLLGVNTQFFALHAEKMPGLRDPTAGGCAGCAVASPPGTGPWLVVLIFLVLRGSRGRRSW